MILVPNTQVQVTFLPPPDGLPAQLFYQAQESGPSLASVNAGNSDGLWVGGGGLNKAFNDLLSAQDTGQTTSQYGPLHKAILAKAEAASGEAVETYATGDPVALCYARSARVTDKAGWYDGVCFMDVFGPAVAPHGNASNAAMLYVAPPKDVNYAGAAAFIKAIGETAEHMIATVAAYNAMATQHRAPAIEALRMCLYSSGIYNKKLNLSRHRIARAIYAGLCVALQKGDSGLKELQFPVPADPLFSAVQADLT